MAIWNPRTKQWEAEENDIWDPIEKDWSQNGASSNNSKLDNSTNKRNTTNAIADFKRLQETKDDFKKNPLKDRISLSNISKTAGVTPAISYGKNGKQPEVISGNYNTLASWVKNNLKPNLEASKITKKQAATALLAQVVQVTGEDPADISAIETNSLLGQIGNDLGIVKELNDLGLYYIQAKPQTGISTSTGTVTTDKNDDGDAPVKRNGNNWTVSTGQVPSYKTTVSTTGTVPAVTAADPEDIRITPANYAQYLLRDEDGDGSTVRALSVGDRFKQSLDRNTADRGMMEWEEPAMRDGTMRFGTAMEQAMNPMYAVQGLSEIINSVLYANDPEELERANVRAAKRYASYTVPAMRAPENMEELLWDVAGTAYGNMMQNALFSLMGPTGAGTTAADAVLTNTGNQRLAKAIGRSVDNTMAGLPINVLQGLAVDGEAEDKIRAMAKGVLYDALSGYGSSRIEDIAGDAYAWFGKNRARRNSGTDLATMTDDEYYRRVMAHMDAVTSDNSTGRAVLDNISAPGQTSDGLSDDEYFRMLQRYVDEGAVDDYYRTANKELTTSGADTTSPNLEYVVSETDAQHYKPFSLDQNNVISTEYKTLPCVASKAIGYDNIYISNKLNLKRRQLHYVNTRIKKAATLVTSNADFEMPRVIICDPTELPTKTAAAYTAHDNTLRINSAITTKKGVLALPKDGACSDNHNSIYVHEMLHWADAQAYMAAHGSADGYLEANVKWAKNNIDKLRNSGYNIEDISEYARKSFRKGTFDEVWTEYRVLQILKE